MKKLIFACAAIAVSFTSFAQSDSTGLNIARERMMNYNQMDMSKTDGCMMMNGKMMRIAKGKMSTMTKPMTMGNGTKIMVDGTCVKKDGTKMIMKEGDHMGMSGNIHPRNIVKVESDY